MSPAQAAFFAQEGPVLAAFARQFSLDPEIVYLMAGQKGSQPDSVRKRYHEGLDQIARDPYPVHLEPPATTRARIAHGYGASVDEIAISRNTTDALSQILMGIEWQRGDEILVTPMEHPAGLATVLRMSARFGVRIVQWGVPVERAATADEVVEALRKRVRPGVTRAIFFSSPLWPNGQRLPERRIAALAQEAGAITVADGAHYGGMIEPRSGRDRDRFLGHLGPQMAVRSGRHRHSVYPQPPSIRPTPRRCRAFTSSAAPPAISRSMAAAPPISTSAPR